MTNILAKTLNEQMDKIGLSRKKLAELSGVPRTTIQNICNDRVTEPRYGTLDSLSAYVGIDLTTIAAGTSDTAELIDYELAEQSMNITRKIFADKNVTPKKEEFFITLNKTYNQLYGTKENGKGASSIILSPVVKD